MSRFQTAWQFTPASFSIFIFSSGVLKKRLLDWPGHYSRIIFTSDHLWGLDCMALTTFNLTLCLRILAYKTDHHRSLKFLLELTSHNFFIHLSLTCSVLFKYISNHLISFLSLKTVFIYAFTLQKVYNSYGK